LQGVGSLVIFLRYESFRGYLKLYPITSLIIALNTVLFLAMAVSGGSTNNATLIRFGALSSYPPYDDLWRYAASVFLHIGFDHFLFNNFAIFIFAPPLERILGKGRYIVFYLGSGIAANIVSNFIFGAVLSSRVLSAGASGAIYGIYAAFLYMAIFRKHALDYDSRKTIMIIIVIGFVYSFFTPHVNLFAHAGGLAAGFALFAFWFRRR
jgi:rhomboid protease GluP